jgi:hypothetical protein
MRRRLNYANVTATLALFFAMTGGAFAAKHYVLNSTKQINPKLLSVLKGKPGPTGPAGANGPQGQEGSKGLTGPKSGSRASGSDSRGNPKRCWGQSSTRRNRIRPCQM